MSKKKKKQKPKEKVRYIDDGRTIADMSGTGKMSPLLGSSGKKRASFKEQWKTYISAVKMMFFPMLVVLGILTIAFIIMYFAYK